MLLTRANVTVVIPTFREAERLVGCLDALAQCTGPLECIVVDGGGGDGTEEVVGRYAFARYLKAPKGRGHQQNVGARAGRGDLLWFLHADCLPSPGSLDIVRQTLADPRLAVGSFRFALRADGLGFRVIELGVALRNAILELPYGDQGLFMRRELFERLGGFPAGPMEDLRLVRAARRLGGRIRVLKTPLPTSARRWEREGKLRTTLRNWSLLVMSLVGVPAERAARRVSKLGLGGRPDRRENVRASEALIVFAREPVPGRTKTRLARAIGDEQATAVYVRMAEHIACAAASVERPGLEVHVLVEPREAVESVASWLGAACSALLRGGSRLRFQGQAPGDLGDRLRAAFGQRFTAGAKRVIAIGTDCPDVGAEAIDAAFSALVGADAVLGPAQDGGYYLLGLSRPLEVFEGIPWSTPDVARVTIEKLERAGADVVELEVFSDIDDVDDLRAALPRWRDLFEGVEPGGVSSARATPPEA